MIHRLFHRRKQSALCFYPVFGVAAILSVLSLTAPKALAQVPSTATPAGTPLPRLLDQLSRTSGLLVVADSTLVNEHLPSAGRTADDLSGATRGEEPEKRVEAQIIALVKMLPPGTTWVKLYLPPRNGKSDSTTKQPSALPRWQGDDVAAYAFAQARLMGGINVQTPADSVEILGQQVPKDKAQEIITRLNLHPVYLLTHLARRGGTNVGAEPWSPLSRNEWIQMSSADRKTFGQQQAIQIMSMSPEERARVLDQMKQQDRFFDSIKDPLEKMVGHDL